MPTQSEKIEGATWDPEINLLAWLAVCVSVFSFLFYYRHSEVLLYGDAIAHINIARRVFDSKTPGLLQLGTVWLPLLHLLIIPFIVSTELWRGGAGGSIPSMAAYVFSVIGIFRLTRDALSHAGQFQGAARAATWIATLIYAANPNLIYMQSTAMGEILYLAFFIWAVFYFSQSCRGQSKALMKCAVCLVGACLTRYDGWFLTAIIIGLVLGPYAANRRRLRRENVIQTSTNDTDSVSLKPASAILAFVLVAVAAPAMWLAYNGIVYRNPLEFADGAYSAKAIEQKSQSAGNAGHPGSGNPFLAGLYFLKSAEDNVALSQLTQRAWIFLILAGAVTAIYARRFKSGATPQLPPCWPLFLLIVPLPFYALSIAYGGVPVFVPNWWPFTHYNVRYGLQLLPAFAISIAILLYLILRWSAIHQRLRLACTVSVFIFVVVSYVSIWQATPICLREAQLNMRTRHQLQMEVARWIEKLPANSTLLMYLGDHVGALERAAFPLKRTINEGNHRVWKQPSDSDGLWEKALSHPSQHADFVLAFEGDPVWQAVHDKNLRELIELHVTGQPRAVLYAAR